MRLPALSLTALLAACSTYQPAPDTRVSAAPSGATPPAVTEPLEAAPAPRPRPIAPPRPLADGSQLPAVKGLIGSADRARAVGNVELAAANLERAQRLAPQSAVVYQKLAQVRLQQRRPAEAEQMARKGLAYASAPAQQAELWRLIATARQQQGRTAEAREAAARAAELEAGGTVL